MNENCFRVLVVDDKPEARILLKSLLLKIKNVEVVGEAGNSENALYLIVTHLPNLILMDINMPGKTGMDLVHLMKSRNLDIPVIFISAFKDYAVDAIRNQVYDFLLKPVCKEDLWELVEKYKRLNVKALPVRLMEALHAIKDETKIRINSQHSYILLNPADITYCLADDGYTTIYLNNGKTEIAYTSLTQIKQIIKQDDFYHLGRTLLINLSFIRRISKSNNKCTLKHNGHVWEVVASHKSIKKLLNDRFNNA
jgi:DNA-binding LytR/AlgR family response regulator